jgi:hypothetical protein
MRLLDILQVHKVLQFADRLARISAVPKRQFGDFEKQHILISGRQWLAYPNSLNKKIDHTKKHIPTVIWPYAATVLSDLDATALAKSLKVGGEDHIFIKFDEKHSMDLHTGKIVNSLKPTGISGGALIDLGNLADLDRFAEPGTGGRLVGLLIEHRARYKAMVATRMTTIIRAIRSHRAL